MLKILLLGTTLFLGSCCYLFPNSDWLGGCRTFKCYSTWYPAFGNYQVKPNIKTPHGTPVDVDLSKHNPDLVKLDARLEAIEKCMLPLMEKYKDKSSWKPEWYCIRKEIEVVPIKRECVAIKIVDAVKSSCSDWEFLPDLAPQELCDVKGLEENPECPCRWRTLIHSDSNIITPPAIYLWNVVHIMTGCSGFWNSPFAACAML